VPFVKNYGNMHSARSQVNKDTNKNQE